jgi:hypothetical protein
MRFQRDATVNLQGALTGMQNGYPTYSVTTEIAAADDFFINNGSTAGWFTLPVGAYDPNELNDGCVFEQECHGYSQIIIEAHINAYGAAGLTGVYVSIEFQDPDNHDLWIPSREPDFGAVGGVEAPLRDDLNALRSWAGITVLGDYLLPSRVEHEHFDKFRLRVRGNGAPDGDTDLRFYWYGNNYRTAW